MPRLVDDALAQRLRPANAAALLPPAARRLLRTVATQPFHAAATLNYLLNGRPATARRALHRLRTAGLVRFAAADEVGPLVGERLVEATSAGLAVVAAELGPTAARAYAAHGLVGGGPEAPVGPRALLLRRLAHTLAVNAFVVTLCRAAAARRAVGGDVQLAAWWNEAVCADGRLKPDGLGVLLRDGRRHAFLLEVDRGTERALHYREKFGAYLEHRDRGRLAWRFGQPPPVLVVCATADAEVRAARVLASLARRSEPLPVLLTTWRRIRENPLGPLGGVWREAAALTRRSW